MSGSILLGVGLTQSDEFCDVYERFMEEYNHGKGVPDISKEIIAQYHEEFNDEDGIMHDVYFVDLISTGLFRTYII